MNRRENIQSVSDAGLTPEAAVARLIALHDDATAALHGALDRFFQARVPPSIEERRRFRYPELRVTHSPDGTLPSLARAYAKFEQAGAFATTITQPHFFQPYLLEQLKLLVADIR